MVVVGGQCSFESCVLPYIRFFRLFWVVVHTVYSRSFGLVHRLSFKDVPHLFRDVFLPLASVLRSRAADAERASQQIDAKTYSMLLEHVWALLPGFFTEPLDMQAALFAQGGQLAKQLVAVIVNEPHLRGHVNVGLARACADTLTPRSRLSRTLQECEQQHAV